MEASNHHSNAQSSHGALYVGHCQELSVDEKRKEAMGICSIACIIGVTNIQLQGKTMAEGRIMTKYHFHDRRPDLWHKLKPPILDICVKGYFY
ncbi:hypothetical protein ACFX19_022548 [Malus domestica]